MNHVLSQEIAKAIVSVKRDPVLEEKHGIAFADEILGIELEYKVASALLDAYAKGFNAGVETLAKNYRESREVSNVN